MPLMARDTAKIHRMVKSPFDQGVLVVGLTFPVMPKDDEPMRFHLNVAHTKMDVEDGLDVLSVFKG